MSATSIIPEEDDKGEWVADYCAWWVIAGGYSTRSSSHIHVPAAVADEGGDDPDEEPPAVTLCPSSKRKDSRWGTKSHAVFPPGYRRVCSKCQKELAAILARREK